MKHLTKLADLTKEEILDILNLADQLKYEYKHNLPHKRLEGKTLAMIFSKASTRTRVSFEAGMYQLGGYALFLSGNEIQLKRGEPIEDTAKVLSRYVQAIMIRTFDQSEVELLAEHSEIPVINGLTDYCHPCQVLADLMTIREYKKTFKDLKLCYVGDGNNMANSLIVGCVKLGIEIAIACPKGYEPDGKLIEWGEKSGKLSIHRNVLEAAKNADVLYTDVWASMGQEEESAIRKEVFKGYQINSNVMSVAKSDAMVLHCLPAHRGEEITSEVIDKHSQEIFDEAENRLHAQKAVLVMAINNSK